MDFLFRSLVKLTQKILVDLRSEVTQHKNILRNAEAKAHALKRQLISTERIIKGKTQHINYLNGQVTYIIFNIQVIDTYVSKYKIIIIIKSLYTK